MKNLRALFAVIAFGLFAFITTSCGDDDAFDELIIEDTELQSDGFKDGDGDKDGGGGGTPPPPPSGD